MKCKAKLIYTKSGKLWQTISPTATVEQINYFISQISKKQLENIDLYSPNSQMYECQGKVTGTIKAEDEPYYGGSSASLSIEYECSECKNTWYENLPNKYTINEWFNAQLALMD